MAYKYGFNTRPAPTRISKKSSLSLSSTPYPCLSQNPQSQKSSASFASATTQWCPLRLAHPTTSVGNIGCLEKSHQLVTLAACLI